jgi:hypothetical protein
VEKEGTIMRRMWATGVAILVSSTLAGVPAMAQDASPTRGSAPASPAAASAPVWVTGTATCPTADLGDVSTDADGVQHFRNGTFRCIKTTDDARVSGTETTTTWNADWYGAPDLSKGEFVQWATVRLENDGGSWEGRLSGVGARPEPGDIIVVWYTGTGGYAGLSYFEQTTGREPFKLQGLIFPGEPPTP